jgi:hypothetical protein
VTARRAVLAALGLICWSASAVLSAQVAVPNPKEMSGSVLPVTDLPVGTVSVRVIRGSFDKNLPNQPVEFLVDGTKTTVNTDASGRAQVTGLAGGARVRASTVVDGEKLESQEAVVESSGLRIILVATDPATAARAAEDRALAASPPVKGIVVLGPESRVVAQMSNDRLQIYYVLEIVNTARTPVDIGGPLIIDLPREARGATIIEGSSPQATANGPRVRVVGPFAPGITRVEAGYELPFSGDTARVTQVMPAKLDQVTLLVLQTGGLSLTSPQLASQREMTNNGPTVIVGNGPGLEAGQVLTFEIAGLPHRATWPRNLALSLASVIVAAGLWAAATARAHRRAS